ncbi:hypothetical protein PWO95_01950 [Weissella paramesenteroides]|uniref:hypothetical protein n=1 Tax=Weissella paramesenteroides TaxID=1249 RepID=UPI0023A94656|nr:hypothetical protein [Weissella paramesenteroides]WEA53341.1 hypothetical protein PWO95_01950 [Weissella paramesenteroides]
MLKNKEFEAQIDDDTLNTGATVLAVIALVGVVDAIALIGAIIWMNKFTWFVFCSLSVIFIFLQVMFHMWRKQVVRKLSKKVADDID